MATLYTVEGDVKTVAPANGKDFKLDELYKILECDYVKVLALDNHEIMLYDEDAYFNNKYVNVHATDLAFAKHVIRPDDNIMGAVVVCDTRQFR